MTFRKERAMKRLMTGLAVLGLMLVLCAADSQAQGYYHRGGHHPSYHRGRTHGSPWGSSCYGPKCRPYPCRYPVYACPPSTYWGGYPYYTGYYLPSYPFYYQNGCVSSSFVSGGYYSSSGFGVGGGFGFRR